MCLCHLKDPDMWEAQRILRTTRLSAILSTFLSREGDPQIQAQLPKGQA